MAVYLGTPGRLVELWSTPTQSMDPSDPITTAVTLEGRVKARRSMASRRTWSVKADLSFPGEAAAWTEFAAGAWGSGPWWFFPADSPGVNVLTPGVSMLLPGYAAGATGLSFDGPRNLADGGIAAQSIRAVDGAIMQFGIVDTPVIPGSPITASAYVQGASGFVLAQFFDAAGKFLSGQSLQSLPAGAPSSLVRVSRSGTVPTNAVTVRLSVRDGLRSTRPAITWSSTVLPWGVGQGCEKAVVHEAASEVITTGRKAGLENYTTMSFTVTEVG